jgi:hypothetical protein
MNVNTTSQASGRAQTWYHQQTWVTSNPRSHTDATQSHWRRCLQLWDWTPRSPTARGPGRPAIWADQDAPNQAGRRTPHPPRGRRRRAHLARDFAAKIAPPGKIGDLKSTQLSQTCCHRHQVSSRRWAAWWNPGRAQLRAQLHQKTMPTKMAPDEGRVRYRAKHYATPMVVKGGRTKACYRRIPHEIS